MADELHDISIRHEPDQGECHCMDCGEYDEYVSASNRVSDLQAHAVQHAMATGHRVTERFAYSALVSPRAA